VSVNKPKDDDEDEVNKQLHKVSSRDVIEQLVFDPHHGVVKREIHFGIIDYVTVSYHPHHAFRPTKLNASSMR
jgi:hypothetical protein